MREQTQTERSEVIRQHLTGVIGDLYFQYDQEHCCSDKDRAQNTSERDESLALLTELLEALDQALVGEAYANGMGLAAVEAWESRALAAEAELSTLRAEQTRLREALQDAEQFIVNGVEYGYIRMPNADCPDAAHTTLPKIRAALSSTPTPETTP